MSKTNPFVNRIIGYGTKPADQFQANALNYRTHPQRQRDAVQASLRELGWIGVVVENVATGNLIDGHERVWQALANNEDVPYIQVELSEDEEKLALAIFDPLGAMAETDSAILDALLRDVNTGESALQELLAGLAEENGLYTGDNLEVSDVAPQVDKAAELQVKWQTATGQLWQLGEHRLICGDCTDAEVVARVMGGEKADMMFTDPPYGVSYADKNKWLNAVAFGNRIQTPIENDHDNIEDTAKNLWLPAFSCAFECCCDTASFYLFMPQGGDQMMMMMMMMNEAGWMPRHELIWLKNNHVLGRADYNYKHEPILYGWKRKGTHHFYGDFQTSVIECDKPQNSDLHPTMKPLELIGRLIPNNTKEADIVYEPFSGSGTTIIACEQLGRKCRAIEISPNYVAVALQRYFDATGKTPVLVE